MAAGIYLHIPFCKSRCSYCDFATDVYRDSGAVERYVAALYKEVKEFLPPMNADDADDKIISDPCHLRSSAANFFSPDSDIETIYFGGGTPSLLSPAQVEHIMKAVYDRFAILPGAEITMEMNPATVTPETLCEFRSLGINRASFGVQTFDDHSLKILARGHDANDARQTYQLLRNAGFKNVSFDLIAGLPGQTLGAWERNLDQAIRMQPEHLSLYLLEIHEGTPLAEQVRGGRQPQPDEELAAEMYEMMLEKLADAGYLQYEISNFSKPGFESRHNTKYWRLDPVFGFGVSAHSFDGRQRYANERDTAKYVEMIKSDNSSEVMREDVDIASEFIFLGLRLENGIDLMEYTDRFGFDLIGKYRNEIDDMINAELVNVADNRLRLTLKGKLYSNEVFAVFV